MGVASQDKRRNNRRYLLVGAEERRLGEFFGPLLVCFRCLRDKLGDLRLYLFEERHFLFR